MKFKKLLVLVASLLMLSACGDVTITDPSSNNPSSETPTSSTTSESTSEATSNTTSNTTSNVTSESTSNTTSNTTSNVTSEESSISSDISSIISSIFSSDISNSEYSSEISSEESSEASSEEISSESSDILSEILSESTSEGSSWSSESTSESSSSNVQESQTLEFVIADKVMDSGLTYIPNHEDYPDPKFYSDGGLKMNFVNMGIETKNTFAPSNSVLVTLNVKALNENEKNGNNSDVFTFYGLNASGQVVAEEGLDSVSVGENVVTLEAEGIVKVRVIMTDYAHNGNKFCNVSIGGLTLVVSANSSSQPTTSETTSNNPSSETTSNTTSNVTSETTSNTTSENSSVDHSSTSSNIVGEQDKIYTIGITNSSTISGRVSCSDGINYASDNTKLYVDVANALRFGSSSATGKITFNFATPTKVKTVFVDCERYNTDGNSQLKISLSNGETLTEDIGNRDEYTFSFTGNTTSTSISFENTTTNKGRVNVYGITISTSTSGGNGSSATSSTSQSTSNVTSNTPTSNTTSNTTSNVTSNQTTSNNGSLSYDTSDDSYKGTYYSSIGTSLTGDALVKELGNLLASTHKNIGYDGLWTAYKKTDIKPGTNKIWDVYTTCNYTAGSSQCGNYSGEGSCYNREHTVPQSWFENTSIKSTIKCDIYHVLPTDGYVNGWRSNYPFGEVSSATKTSSNGSKLGPSSVSGISGTVFEPIDEYKGDFARIYFYVCTRYYQYVGDFGGNGSNVFKGSYPYLENAYFNLYLKWAIEDPVSQKEIDRNNAAFEFQKNRNPYVDCPSLFYRAFMA